MGDVVSFRRPGKPAPGNPAARAPEALRDAPGARARALAAEQSAARRIRAGVAQTRARSRELIRAGKVVPARITIALDIAGLGGEALDEQVGTWHGNPDGDIDRWEQALAVPSREQVRLLAWLTGFKLAWFYRPLKPGTMPLDGPIWLCGRDGCQVLKPNVITEAGVLLYEGEPRPPVDIRPAPLPGMPTPDAAPPRERPAAAKPAARKRAPRKPPPVVQPPLPKTSGMMPAAIKAELLAKLAARKPR